MINFIDTLNQKEKFLDPHLFHACAGGITQIPPLNSEVYYFPQGHIEHASKNVDFGPSPRIPPFIHCKVSSIKYLADAENDEVYAKIQLVPLKRGEFDEGGLVRFDKNEEKEKPASFAKTLTQSDANNGGGFSVPRYCAETLFPRLDYSSDPPVQTILVKDVQGEVWKFRHIYRGTPRRHLLTTGWSHFVNRKRLVAGDAIVFLQGENGDLCAGIRRAKTGIGGGTAQERCSLGTESVVEAVSCAVSGQPFEVVYYPCAGTPEFVVKASAVRDAMRVEWCAGMRFKMAFETEDSARISWFMGTILSVQVDDPICWPNSPWRLLKAAWDEPELLQNVKRVNPWSVELVSNIPPVHPFPFYPPTKRPRVPQPPNGQLPMPTLFTNNALSPISPLYFLPDNYSSAGIEGARHARFMLSSSDLHFNMGPRPFDFTQLDYVCPLKMKDLKKNDEGKSPVFILFGRPILTEEQISRGCSMDDGRNSLSGGNQENVLGNVSNGSSDEEFFRFDETC